MEDKLFFNKKERLDNSNKIGNKMYKKNWEKLISGMKEVDPVFGQYVQEIAYGSIYPRDNLDLKSREIIAIVSLTQLKLKPQLKSHIIAALNNGMTENEIRELFLHLSMFIGFPLVLDGLKVAKEVFDYRNENNN